MLLNFSSFAAQSESGDYPLRLYDKSIHVNSNKSSIKAKPRVAIKTLARMMTNMAGV